MVKPERADVSVVAANSTPATCFANEHLLHTPTPATDSLRSAAGARVVPGRLASKLGDPVPDARSLDARWAIRSSGAFSRSRFVRFVWRPVLSDPVSDSRGAEAQFVRDPHGERARHRQDASERCVRSPHERRRAWTRTYVRIAYRMQPNGRASPPPPSPRGGPRCPELFSICSVLTSIWRTRSRVRPTSLADLLQRHRARRGRGRSAARSRAARGRAARAAPPGRRRRA